MKNILIAFVFLACTNSIFAQEVKDVTLTEIGVGKTKDDAFHNALRNAVEKAFGTFISSNTTILNDALVKDEIVSVTNGNIKKFEMLSETQMPDGSYTSVVKATVSVSKLTTFCENKGVTVEFKGALFAANIKIQEMNKTNEESVIHNLCYVLDKMADKAFDFSIEASDPVSFQNNWKVPLKIVAKANKNMTDFEKLFSNVIAGISLSKSDVETYEKQKTQIFSIQLNGNKYYLRSRSSIPSLLYLAGKTIPTKAENFIISNGIYNTSCSEIITSISAARKDPHGAFPRDYNSATRNWNYWWGQSAQGALQSTYSVLDNFKRIKSLVMGVPPSSSPSGGIEEAIMQKDYPGYITETVQFNLSTIMDTEFTFIFDNYLPTADLSKVKKYEVKPSK